MISSNFDAIIDAKSWKKAFSNIHMSWKFSCFYSSLQIVISDSILDNFAWTYAKNDTWAQEMSNNLKMLAAMMLKLSEKLSYKIILIFGKF